MRYEIVKALGKWRIWAVRPDGNAEIVKVFASEAAARRWVAKHS